MQAPESKFVQVTEGPLKDFKIHYQESGSGDNVVVMMHGSGPGASSWSTFNRNVAPLVEAGYRAVLIDSPGWSESDPIVVETGPRSVYNAAAVKGVLDAMGIQKAHLIGNSMGGAGAFQFALNFPERTGKLVVMGSGGAGQSLVVPMPPEGIKLIGALYRNPTTDNLKRMLDVFVYDTSALDDSLVEGRFKNMMKREDHVRNFAKTAELNPRHLTLDLTSQLGQIKSPTLIIWGREDRFVPLDCGLRLLGGLPNARMHIFNRCGHWAQWEHADEFNRLVMDFLKH